jgi:hypothetical protein
MDKGSKLLVKDICARLPYGLKVRCVKYTFPVTVLYAGDVNEVKFKETGGIEHIDEIKPYLRPLSSMTDEEKTLMATICLKYVSGNVEGAVSELSDFYNSRHFDYRGLIPIGLALVAPTDMYKK